MPFVTRRFRFPLFVALIALLATPPAFSQVAATGIAGVVKDPSDAVISGASVKIYNAATDELERQMTTGNNGEFVATLLRPGTYRIAVSAQGFKNYESTVEVRIGETVKNVAKLQIGTGKESVTVDAIPSLVNTESATTGQPIDARTIGALPLPTPNFMFLLTLSTGSMGEPPDVRAANRGNVDINVNGQRTSNNGVSLEGINVNDLNLAHFDVIPLPNTHAIQEFKTATSLFDASQGNKGGGAVNLVLKTGTKAWHGSAYWDHRNDALNANEWFHKKSQIATGVPNKPGRLLQNVFGAELGGPVPLLKGFWYVNIQGVRARNGVDPSGSTTQPTVPVFATNPDGTTTAALLAAGGYAPSAAAVDPTALAILNLKNPYWGGTYAIPRSGQPGCPVTAVGTTMSCFFTKITPIRDDQYTMTYDRPFSNGKQKIGLRWFWDNGNYAKPFGTDTSLTFPRSDQLRNRFASISHTYQISDRQLNEFRFGFSRYNSVAGKPTDIISLADIGATRGNSAEFPGIYRIGITSAWSLGTGVNDDRGTVNNQFYWGDTWSISLGRHVLRAGAEIVRFQINRYNNFAVRGALAFDSFNNFVQGIINGEQNAFGQAGRYFRDTDYSYFFQDDFKLRPTLTLNLGLRWEGVGWAHDKFLRNAVIDPSVIQNAPANSGAVPILYPQNSFLPGVTAAKGIGDCGVKNCRAMNNWAPRVGFAWDIFGNQKTVLRGGFGMYYQRLSNQNLLQGSLAPPFTVQPITANPTGVTLANPLPASTVTGLVGAPFTPTGSFFTGLRYVGGSGCPADPGPPYNVNNPCVGPRFVDAFNVPCNGFGSSGVFPGPTNSGHCGIFSAAFSSVLPNARTPYNEEWNLSIQRDLGSGWAVEAAYVGAHYVGGLGIYQPFLAPLVSASSPITVKDTAGNSYTINQNTINNEALRFQLLGLSRRSGYRIDGNIGFATYHSGQFTLSHRFSHGLYLQAGYTYSKNIDNVSGSQSTDELNATRTGQSGANILNDQSNYHQNRARSDFDRPHRFVVSYVWEIPVPKSGIWGSQAFQGWSISGLTQYQNGLPFSLSDSSSGRAFGGGTGTGLLVCRPAAQQITSLPTCIPGSITTVSQLIMHGSVENNLAHYINPNFVTISQVVGLCNGQDPVTGSPANCLATSSSSPTGYGNVPRNAFRAPFQQDWDVSITKRFRLHEQHTFQFRADFFNVFNHPIFGTPSSVNVNQTTPGTSIFGLINSTAIPARIIQLGLKYSF